MIAFFGIFEFLFVLPLVLLGILGTVFWLWMLIDAALNEPSEGSDKVVWVLIILLTHFIGAVIYFFARRPNRPARFR